MKYCCVVIDDLSGTTWSPRRQTSESMESARLGADLPPAENPAQQKLRDWFDLRERLDSAGDIVCSHLLDVRRLRSRRKNVYKFDLTEHPPDSNANSQLGQFDSAD